MERHEDVHSELQTLFGEPVNTVLKKRARTVQESRLAASLGVSSAGIISRNGPSIVPAHPHTFYGEQ
jgi:hypothetical protein